MRLLADLTTPQIWRQRTGWIFPQLELKRTTGSNPTLNTWTSPRSSRAPVSQNISNKSLLSAGSTPIQTAPHSYSIPSMFTSAPSTPPWPQHQRSQDDVPSRDSELTQAILRNWGSGAC